MDKEESAIVAESVMIMAEVGVRMRFEENSIRLDDELIEREWKLTWRKVKSRLQKGLVDKRIDAYKTKQLQSNLYREQEDECHLWLTQNLNTRKTASIS